MSALPVPLRCCLLALIWGLGISFGGVAAAVADQTGPSPAGVEQGGLGVEMSSSKPGAGDAFLRTLTAEERAWLREHPVIRVAQDPGWPPIEFANELGEPSGMSWDYVQLLSSRLGVTFEPIRDLSWQESYARLQRREIDMTTSVAVTPDRERFWAFTKPYMRIPIAIVTHTDVTYVADLRELVGRKVAVVEGYAVNDWIPRDYPELELVQVDTTWEGLDALQRGEVFAYVENILVIDYYIARKKLKNFKIAGSTPYVNAQCMAVRKDWAILAGILDKALDSISNAERDAIYRRWVPIRYEHKANYTWLWQTLIILVLVVLLLVGWNRQLSREIRYRKQAEASLAHSRERLALATASAHLGIWDWEVGPDRLVWDSRMYELFGVREQDCRSADEVWEKSLHPDDRDRIEDNVQAALSRGSDLHSQFRIIRPNGEVRIIETQAVVQRASDGSATRLIGTNCDITERYQAEEALRTSEQLTAGIINSIPVRVFWKDLNLVYLGCNAAFARDAGFDDSRDIIGKDDFQLGWREQAEAYRTDDRQVIASGRAKYFIEESQTTPEGKKIELLTSKLPLRDAKGEICGVLGTYLDITQRKHMEEALRDSLREKDALLQEVHHRVKNNLQVITSLLRLEASKNTARAAREPLREMQSRIRSMALLHEMVYRTGSFARVNLADYLGELAAHLFRAQNTAGGKVRLALELEPATVDMDQAIPCGLIVNELMTNSLKYGFPEGKTGEVRMSMQQNADGQIRITVSDTGVGLPENFDPAQTKSLGLRLVSDLTEQLLGTLTVAPKASFTVAFTPTHHDGAKSPSLHPTGTVNQGLGSVIGS